MSRNLYSTPRLRRLGNVADITQGTGTGPGNLGDSPLGSGGENAPVKIYGDYSSDQVGGILNGSNGK